MKKFILTSLSIFLIFGSLLAQHNSFKVEIKGTGQPVIFLPGFTTPGSVWNATIESLVGNFKTYQFTYAGFDGVPPIEFPWYPSLSSEIQRFIETEDIKNAIVIGHSMGGMLAIELAANSPNRISKMILVDALPNIKEIILPQVPIEQIQYKNPYNDQIIAMTDSAMRVTAGYMVQGMSNNPEYHEKLINWIIESDRETYVYGYTDLLKLDLRDRLKSIEAETLILTADFPDKETALETVSNQFSNLKTKSIKVASNSKHFIMFDQPEWLYQEMNNFISGDEPK